MNREPSHHRARVITCSDSAADGTRSDQSGPAVRERLLRAGFEVEPVIIVPDVQEQIASAIVRSIDEDGITLVVTTGGTGISPRDVTPEATAKVTIKHLPGFGERMRAVSLSKTAMAPLSRAGASVRGSALVVNLPGSVSGAVENLEAILDLIPHALDLLSGGRGQQHSPATKGPSLS